MTEEWRPIKGFEGVYEVSSHGGVRRCAGYYSPAGRVLRQFLVGPVSPVDGRDARYFVVNLSHKNQRFPRKVHRLVAEAFVAGEGPLVRHLDGNSRNNRYDNLAWGTIADNAADMVRHGTQSRIGYPIRPFCKNGHPFNDENTFVRLDSGRGCRICRSERQARYRARKAANS